MELTTEDADTFLMNKINKKLDYWTTVRLNSAGRAVISNSIFISMMLYFLGIWGGGGSTGAIKRIKGKIRNFFWTGSPSPSRARVAWQILCFPHSEGGLNIIDP
jgi:hypothetical protein